MKVELVLVGECCQKCRKGVMKNMPEEILEDGTVVYTAKCNACGHFEKFKSKPSQSVRRTGTNKCNKCGYEYFYVSTKEFKGFPPNLKDFLDEVELFRICPSCSVRGYQMRMMESYGPLKHEHGHYGNHPITRKHRKVK